MADKRIALIELIEQQADTDLVREMLAFAADRIMGLEMELRTGAAKGVLGTARGAAHWISGAGLGYPGGADRAGDLETAKEQPTDLSGNDHNRVVYVTKCGSCGHSYGADGSDIWQQKCLACGGGTARLAF